MEQENKATKKRLVLFIVYSMVLGWAMFLIIPFAGLSYGEGTSILILAAAMFTPTLSNVLTRLTTKEGFKNMYLRPNFKGHVKTYLLVFFGPSVLLLLGGAIYFLIFPGVFDANFTQINALLEANGPQGVSAANMLLIAALQVIIIGPVINIIPTLGEELGWRGYLQPKLRQFFSDRKAVVITGAIWGFWHLPVIAMGHNYGTDYMGFPWLGILP